MLLSSSKLCPQGRLHLPAPSSIQGQRQLLQERDLEDSWTSPTPSALPQGFGKAPGEEEPPRVCVGEGSRWAPCCLLAATQGLLQEIPALQHFLHTPRGPETSPAVVFLACPASAPMAQHRDNRRSAWVPAGSGAQHPSAIPGGKRRWEKRAPEPSKAPWPLISTDQTCPTGEAQRGSNLPEGNCWFSPSERRVTPQGRATPGLQGTAAPLPKHSSKRCQKPLSQRNLCLPTLKAAEQCAARVEFGVPASATPNCHLGAAPSKPRLGTAV